MLREVITLGANHIDTAEFYGTHISNQLIREALSPYTDDLVIVTKVGVERGKNGEWHFRRTPADLIRQVNDNLSTLGLDALEVVNLRMGGSQDAADQSLEASLNTLIRLQREGLIHHIGLSCITPAQYAEARSLVDIVCVQNHYNHTQRVDDAFIDKLASEGVAYVPLFPPGGFTPLESSLLSDVARKNYYRHLRDSRAARQSAPSCFIRVRLSSMCQLA